jgi:hypothetical protein
MKCKGILPKLGGVAMPLFCRTSARIIDRLAGISVMPAYRKKYAWIRPKNLNMEDFWFVCLYFLV